MAQGPRGVPPAARLSVHEVRQRTASGSTARPPPSRSAAGRGTAGPVQPRGVVSFVPQPGDPWWGVKAFQWGGGGPPPLTGGYRPSGRIRFEAGRVFPRLIKRGESTHKVQLNGEMGHSGYSQKVNGCARGQNQPVLRVTFGPGGWGPVGIGCELDLEAGGSRGA